MRHGPKEREISQKLIEDLLIAFLSGALGLELHQRIEQQDKLPAAHRDRLEAMEGTPSWIAWVTNVGVVTATGRYDADQSRRTYSHIIFIERWMPDDTHHASWWGANPQRPTEWTAGRGSASCGAAPKQ